MSTTAEDGLVMASLDTPKPGDWVTITHLVTPDDEPHLRVGENYEVTYVDDDGHGLPTVLVRLHSGGEDALVAKIGDRWAVRS